MIFMNENKFNILHLMDMHYLEERKKNEELKPKNLQSE